MLTDVFFRRYEGVPFFPAFTERERRFLGQAAQIITDELFPRNKARYKDEADDPATKAQDTAHKKLARELGLDYLAPLTFVHSWKAPNGDVISQNIARTIDNRTKFYLTQNIAETSSTELFMKFRISFVELCFQEKSRQLKQRREFFDQRLSMSAGAIKLYDDLQIGGGSWQAQEKRAIEEGGSVLGEAVIELNERFRQAKMPLSYHNGFVQISDDAAIENYVEKAFWDLMAQAKWSNVDYLIKEAIDKRDRSERDAVSPAMQALESVIKIISDEKQWTMGHEKGAANYINNLVAERNGVRFIDVWEKDALIDLFGKIRNHFGHGPGNSPIPTLRREQTDWLVEAVMVWCKSLIRRI